MGNSSDKAQSLYLRLVEDLRLQIRNHQFPAGSQLPTEAELIERYGVSRGTVRQALGVLTNEGLIERIKGSGSYVRDTPPVEAQPSANGGRQIGLLLSQSSDQLNMEILIGVEQGARARGYRVLFSYAEQSISQTRHEIQRFSKDRVQGMIVFPVGENAEAEGLLQLHEQRIPYVLVDRYFPDIPSDYVVADNFNGAYRAVEHLLILGYRRIGFVFQSNYSLSVTSIYDRWAGYRAALESYGLPYDERLIFHFSPPQSSSFLLDHRGEFDALFASNDLEALAILKGAQRHNLRVPDDFALVGFDDLNFAAHVSPALTTVAQQRTELGLKAINLLIDRIEGYSGAPKQIRVPTHLVVRESCGARRLIHSVSG